MKTVNEQVPTTSSEEVVSLSRLSNMIDRMIKEVTLNESERRLHK